MSAALVGFFVLEWGVLKSARVAGNGLNEAVNCVAGKRWEIR